MLTGLAASGNPRLPQASDFAPGTQFVIKEFDVPLAWVPGQGWFNWFGGQPRPYEGTLRIDNNWPAGSVEEWLGVVEASLPDPVDYPSLKAKRCPR
jgi:hypothetical protein